MTPDDFDRVRLAAAMAWTRVGCRPFLPVDPHHEAMVEGYVEAYAVARKRRPLVRVAR